MCHGDKKDEGPKLVEPTIISSGANPPKPVVASPPQKIVAPDDDVCKNCGGSKMSGWTSCPACS